MRGQDYKLGYSADAAGVDEHPKRGHREDKKDDAVQMPLNVMDAHYDSFEKKVLPVLLQHEIGVLGMKSMGDHLILESQTVTPIECLHPC
jgi:hypothetical protein